ncbi:unnamed protein product [marine sediment metagenome]|uniref:Metalloprotease TldD/E N-terminal domain-containing protein n=1 Tax=marine sediment metagenome TaxID=412755 RepID=X1BMN3_9ZZZZ
MFEKLQKILSNVDADYSDIRYEIKKDTVISFNGKELTKIGSNSTDGYVLRVLKNGGLSSVAFTKENDSEKAVNTAMENAQLIAKNIEKPIEFAQTEVVRDIFIPELKEDPPQIPM